MGGLFEHWYYLLIVLVVVLIIWGPGKLPDVGAGLGKAIKEFRKASTETHDAIVHATTTPIQPVPAQPATAPQPVVPAQPAAPAETASQQPTVSG